MQWDFEDGLYDERRRKGGFRTDRFEEDRREQRREEELRRELDLQDRRHDKYEPHAPNRRMEDDFDRRRERTDFKRRVTEKDLELGKLG